MAFIKFFLTWVLKVSAAILRPIKSLVLFLLEMIAEIVNLLRFFVRRIYIFKEKNAKWSVVYIIIILSWWVFFIYSAFYYVPVLFRLWYPVISDFVVKVIEILKSWFF